MLHDLIFRFSTSSKLSTVSRLVHKQQSIKRTVA